MTPEEFAKKVRGADYKDIHGNASDPEMTHAETDELMMTVLRELGYGEGVDLIQTMTRWYA